MFNLIFYTRKRFKKDFIINHVFFYQSVLIRSLTLSNQYKTVSIGTV